MIKRYFINFWIWWYFVRVRESARDAMRVWLYILSYTNTFVMMKNLFVPMFQDYSSAGRMTSLFIRISWIIFGSIVQILVTPPLVIYVAFVLILPFLPLIMIVRYFFI